MLGRSTIRVDGRKSPPFVVVEFLCPESGKTDCATCIADCAAAGVPYYWLGHPEEQWIEAYELTSDGFSRLLQKSTKADGLVALPPFQFEVNLGSVFDY
eukprot:jgi/Chrzof1/5620/Cz16g09070.t1